MSSVVGTGFIVGNVKRYVSESVAMEAALLLLFSVGCIVFEMVANVVSVVGTWFVDGNGKRYVAADSVATSVMLVLLFSVETVGKAVHGDRTLS